MQDGTKTSAMFELVEQWQQSGKSQNQFSVENGIKVHTLGYWIRKYRESQGTHSGFTSLNVRSHESILSTQPRLEIELGGGMVVRIY